MKENVILRPADYQNVILKEGRARQQFEEALIYFMALPNDDILYGFRKRAGLSHPGRELGGWYSNDGSFNIYDWDEIFNPFGQWLAFFAKAYRITGDQKVYDKLKILILEWGKTIGEDGYFFYSDHNNAWHYSYEKLVTGLTDAYLYAGIREAETYLKRITEWAEKNLPVYRNRAGESRASFTGGETSVKGIDNEWYTLPENLYRAYLATGDAVYREFADQWHYDSYWADLRAGRADTMRNVHGYSHVNTLCSAAMAYCITGNQEYLDIIESGYDMMQQYQVMASGGYAFDEHMADDKGSNYKAVEQEARSFEAACGSYAVLKLTRYLLMVTGKACYGDWAEKVLYNSLFAVLPMKDDDRRRGKTFYYADYRIGGGRKVYYEHSFPCCSGTYPQDTAEYHNMIYFMGEDGLFISQYLPSSYKGKYHNTEIGVEIQGNYPVEEEIVIFFQTDCRCPVHLRIPSWVKEDSFLIKVTGKKERSITLKGRAGEWLTVTGVWEAGDKMMVSFPMRLYTVPITKDHPERAALMYGPVLLAAEGKHWTIGIHTQNPEKKLIRKGKELIFEGTDEKGKTFVFKPLWEFQEKEWYTVYMDYEKGVADL